MAHGVVGALTLSREVAPPDVPGMKALVGEGRVRAYQPELTLACSGLQGAVTTRSAVPTGAVKVTAGDSVFQATALERSELNRDFLKALGSARTVSVTENGLTVIYSGPGKALTGHFQRYCKTLDHRATGKAA